MSCRSGATTNKEDRSWNISLRDVVCLTRHCERSLPSAGRCRYFNYGHGRTKLYLSIVKTDHAGYEGLISGATMRRSDRDKRKEGPREDEQMLNLLGHRLESLSQGHCGERGEASESADNWRTRARTASTSWLV